MTLRALKQREAGLDMDLLDIKISIRRIHDGVLDEYRIYERHPRDGGEIVWVAPDGDCDEVAEDGLIHGMALEIRALRAALAKATA